MVVSFLIPYVGANPSGSNTSILPPSGGSRIDAAYLLPTAKENAQDHGGGIAAEVFRTGHIIQEGTALWKTALRQTPHPSALGLTPSPQGEGLGERIAMTAEMGGYR